jgi:hypothetical protein
MHRLSPKLSPKPSKESAQHSPKQIKEVEKRKEAEQTQKPHVIRLAYGVRQVKQGWVLAKVVFECQTQSSQDIIKYSVWVVGIYATEGKAEQEARRRIVPPKSKTGWYPSKRKKDSKKKHRLIFRHHSLRIEQLQENNACFFDAIVKLYEESERV